MRPLQSLWVKITLAVVVLVVAIMASVSYFFSYRELELQRADVRERIERLAKQIASIRMAETEGWYAYQNYIDNLIRADFSRDLVYIAIFDERDSLAAWALNAEWLDLGGRQILTAEDEREVVRLLSRGAVAKESRADLGSVPVQIRDASRSWGTVEVGFSLVELNNAFRRKRLTNFSLLAVFTVVGVVTSALMSYRIVTPLHRLTAAMRRVAAGQLGEVMRVRSSDEIGELARTFNRMVAGLREKEAIERLTHELGFTFEFRRVAQLVTEGLRQAAGARRALLFVQEHEGEPGQFRGVWDSSRGDLNRGGPCLDLRRAEQLRAEKEPFACSLLARGDSELKQALHVLERRHLGQPCALVVPLRAREQLLALVVLSPAERDQEFGSEERRFLATLATQAAMAMDNALLHVRLTEQERLRRELEIAREVQRRLLPQANPSLPGWDIDGICLPAAEVGGDYFDYLDVGQDRLGVVVADVSGKGTSAAFYMAELKGMVTALSSTYLDPGALLCELNRKLRRRLDPRVFATAAYAVVDLCSGRVKLARAGHDNVYLRRLSGGLERLLPPVIGLGLADGKVFDTHIREWEGELMPGDWLVFYTDGITEAMNERREQFGEDTLAALVDQAKVSQAEGLRRRILRKIRCFAGTAAQHDDITLVVVHRVSPDADRQRQRPSALR